MELRNWEMFASTSAPVVGADVSVYEAELDHPNPGSPLDTTNTDSNGMWEFTGLSNTPKDIKVEYSDRTKWYKGMTLHSVSAVYEDVEDAAVEQNILVNGGFEFNTGASSFTPGTSFGDIVDHWQAKRGSGDTLTIDRVTTPVSPDSEYALRLVYTKSAGDAWVQANLPSTLVYALRGQTISLGGQLRQSAGSSARVYITDAFATTNATHSATTGAFFTSEAENFTVNAAATVVQVGVQIVNSGTFYLDNLMLSFGAAAKTYVIRFSDAETFTIVEAAPAADTSRLSVLLNNLAERVKAIAGTADWKDAISVALTGKVSKAGDTMSGNLTLSGHTVSALGLVAGANGVSAGAGGVATSGPVNPASYAGGSTSTGSPSVKGLSVGTDGVLSGGPINPSSYIGGSTSTGTPSVLGLNVGTDGVASAGPLNGTSAALSGGATVGSTLGVTGALTGSSTVQGTRLISTVATGTAPLTVASTTEVANLRAATASNALAIADGVVSTTAKMGTGVVTSTNILDGTIVDGDVAAANKDGASGTASMRTLGTGAAQAAAGNHVHTGMAKSASGTYVGNGGATRAITGVGFAPKIVMIQQTTTLSRMWQLMGHDMILWTTTFTGFATSNTLDADGFTVTLGSGANASGDSFRYVAIG